MFGHRKQGLFLSVFVDDVKMDGKKQNLAPMWNLLKNVDIDEPTSFLDHVYSDVWVTYFCWSNRTISGVAETSRRNSSVVLRHGGTCSKMRWAILRIGKQESGATLQKVSHPCLDDHQFKQEDWNQLEICQKFARQLSWNACTWHELDDLTSCGPWTSLQDQSQNGARHVTDD